MEQQDKPIKPGFFTMDVVIEVCAQKDVAKARAIAMKSIEKMHGYATPENIAKATSMVEKAKDVRKLGLDITNFLLAHPSEGLKTIR